MTGLVLQRTKTVHMAIDMQRLFAEATDWHLPEFHAIVPNIARIAAALPGRSIFTRFTVPHTAADAHGRWRHYYRRWHGFTGAVMDPGLIEIVEALSSHAGPETWLDKPTYSAFEVPDCAARLAALGTETILFTGIETDVCVLATLLAAVDRGYHVVAVSDALASSSPAGHDAVMSHVLPRMPDQIDIAGTDDVLAALAV
jgi:nicotinamidase-related amidase